MAENEAKQNFETILTATIWCALPEKIFVVYNKMVL
jgi:hypothetical protein